MLDQKAVDKFRLIYEEHFEEPLTLTEARVMAQNLVDLYLKLYAVIPEETLRQLWKEEQTEKARASESAKRVVLAAEPGVPQSRCDVVADEAVADASPVEVEAGSLPSSAALQ